MGLLENPSHPATPAAGAAAAEPPSTADLVAAAHGGDGAAWDELVERFGGLVWAIARGHRLGAADAADVCQTVWLRLVENLARLREPEHLGGWLRTTTRNECLRVLRRGNREIPGDDAALDVACPPEHLPEMQMLAGERDRLVWAAVSSLSERCRSLLRVLACAPDASYADISASLGLPVGSIGPTRARCLAHLRRQLEDVGYLAATPEGR